MTANRFFKRIFGKKIDWKNPKNLQEKIYWLLFNTDTSLWTLCADKFRVRKYVEEKGCGDSLVKLYGHWENVDNIDFESLPNQFILKANNGCGTNIVVKDKYNADINEIRKTLRGWLKFRYGHNGSQKHYLRIKPCVISEELLEETGETKEISPNSLIDYKIWCFHGIPECIIVVFNRTPKSSEQLLYDLEWNNISSEVFRKESHYSKIEVPRPKSLPKMLEYARKLSEDIPEVRIDFYDISGKIYFGEMTFTAGYGDLSDDYYEYLGSKIDIEKLK